MQRVSLAITLWAATPVGLDRSEDRLEIGFAEPHRSDSLGGCGSHTQDSRN